MGLTWQQPTFAHLQYVFLTGSIGTQSQSPIMRLAIGSAVSNVRTSDIDHTRHVTMWS